MEYLKQRAGQGGVSRQGTLLEYGPGGFAFELQHVFWLSKGATLS